MIENSSRKNSVEIGSERAFGAVFAVVFAVLAIFDILGSRAIWILLAVLFGTLALVYPRALKPLNRLWFRFGLLLHKITNPVILGFMFYIVITPMAILLKIVGKDILNLKIDKNQKSYWIIKQNHSSMKNQF